MTSKLPAALFCFRASTRVQGSSGSHGLNLTVLTLTDLKYLAPKPSHFLVSTKAIVLYLPLAHILLIIYNLLCCFDRLDLSDTESTGRACISHFCARTTQSLIDIIGLGRSRF